MHLPSASKTGNHEADAHAGRQGNVKQTYCGHSRPLGRPATRSTLVPFSILFLKRGGANTPLNQKHGRGATMFESVANLLNVAALQASADILVVTATGTYAGGVAGSYACLCQGSFWLVAVCSPGGAFAETAGQARKAFQLPPTHGRREESLHESF